MTRKPHMGWSEDAHGHWFRIGPGPTLPLYAGPQDGRWRWGHQNTQERGVADTLDAAKLAAEDSMLAHARLVVETLRPVMLGCFSDLVDVSLHPPRCLGQSPGDPSDEDDPPVTCTREKGRGGKHAGGTRCGTLEWKEDE